MELEGWQEWIVFDDKQRLQAVPLVPGSYGAAPARQPHQQALVELVIPDSQATTEVGVGIPDTPVSCELVIPDSEASTQ